MLLCVLKINLFVFLIVMVLIVDGNFLFYESMVVDGNNVCDLLVILS